MYCTEYRPDQLCEICLNRRCLTEVTPANGKKFILALRVQIRFNDVVIGGFLNMQITLCSVYCSMYSRHTYFNYIYSGRTPVYVCKEAGKRQFHQLEKKNDRRKHYWQGLFFLLQCVEIHLYLRLVFKIIIWESMASLFFLLF